MLYENMPLYPSLDCDGGRESSCVRLPVFGGGPSGGRWPSGGLPEEGCCRRVTVENPCRPGERAEVLLAVDACGNLVVCVRRDPPRPRCEALRNRCERRRGGMW